VIWVILWEPTRACFERLVYPCFDVERGNQIVGVTSGFDWSFAVFLVGFTKLV
jgi:hypothetical protein